MSEDDDGGGVANAEGGVTQFFVIDEGGNIGDTFC